MPVTPEDRANEQSLPNFIDASSSLPIITLPVRLVTSSPCIPHIY